MGCQWPYRQIGIEFNINTVLIGNNSILWQIYECVRSHPPFQSIGRFYKTGNNNEPLISFEQFMNNFDQPDFDEYLSKSKNFKREPAKELIQWKS